MPFILLNKREARALKRSWSKPDRKHEATVKGQKHKVFNISKADMKKKFGERKGILTKRANFEYRAFPDAIEDLEPPRKRQKLEEEEEEEYDTVIQPNETMEDWRLIDIMLTSDPNTAAEASRIYRTRFGR
jgi:hypothetical protein